MIHAFVSLKSNSEEAGELFEKSIVNIPQVTECSVIIGHHDYLIKVVAKDLAHYESLLKKQISTIDCIAKIESTVELKSVFQRSTLPTD